MYQNKKPAYAFANIVFSLIFLILVIIVGIGLMNNNISVNNLGITEFILLILGTFRLIRLVVYDHSMQWLRELFENSSNQFGETMHALLLCPWCFGVWAALISVTLYFLIPFGEFLVLLLAIAGVASFIQLCANLIGWNAESKKNEVNHKR